MMGQPFHRHRGMGYDNHAWTYVPTGMDSMGSGIYFMEETVGKDSNTIIQKGRYDDPTEGPMKLRAVTKVVNADNEVFEMYGIEKHGKAMKMIEITYSRKQSAGG